MKKATSLWIFVMSLASMLCFNVLAEVDQQSQEIDCLSSTASIAQISAAICTSPALKTLNAELNKGVSGFVSALQASGQETLVPAFEAEQERWASDRSELCRTEEAGVGAQTACLERLYEQRIEILRLRPDGEAKSRPKWQNLLLSGEQIGVGGATGSDYWAIVQCGVDHVTLLPGGSLATTGRSALLPSDESAELRSPVGGLEVKGDLNETEVECVLTGKKSATLDFRLARPITEGGPCAGDFGVLLGVAFGGQRVIKDVNLVGYCGAALLKSVNITGSSVDICTLSSNDDPDRNDEINKLPPTRNCTSTAVR